MDVTAATEILARSTPLSTVFWIGYIIIGAGIGFLASKIGDGAGPGVLANIVIGIAGASISGLVLSFAFDAPSTGLRFAALFSAALGSVILLWLVGLLRRT
jgi:uncharacterized membrane protein YeaQ/YmgE (transglycosylase-associated protein family)